MNLDILVHVFPNRVGKIIQIVSQLIMLAVLGLVIRGGMIATVENISWESPALEISYGFVYSMVPFCCSIMFIQTVMSTQILTQGLIRGIDNYPLLAVPFFMVAGEIMNKDGISHRIVRFANVLVGHIKGGLGYVAVISGMIFAGVSGSAIADTAAKSRERTRRSISTISGRAATLP